MKYLSLILLLLSGMVHAASGDTIIKSRKPGGDIIIKAKDSGGTERELLRADADTNTVTVKKLVTPSILEHTPGNGVVIGGVTFKDGSIGNVLIDPKALVADQVRDTFFGTHGVGNQIAHSFLASRYSGSGRPLINANPNCTQSGYGRAFVADIDAFIVRGYLPSVEFKVTRTRTTQLCFYSGGYSAIGYETYDDVDSNSLSYDVNFTNYTTGLTYDFSYAPYYILVSVRVLGLTEPLGVVSPVAAYYP